MAALFCEYMVGELCGRLAASGEFLGVLAGQSRLWAALGSGRDKDIRPLVPVDLASIATRCAECGRRGMNVGESGLKALPWGLQW